MSQPLLVTGAGGQLGRRVVDLLLAQGAGPLIVTTRHPEKLGELRDRGVEVRRVDFDAPAALAEAFAGAARLLLISTDALDRPGRRLAQHRSAIEAAVKAGVEHVVYTSLTNPGPGSPIAIASDHQGTEDALAESGLGATVLRNNLYTDLLLGSLQRALATGQLVAAAGDGKTGYVTREDCARAAAAALAADFNGKRVLDITGPATVSQGDIARIASELTGKPIVYVPIPREALEQGMRQAGLPAAMATLFASFDEGIARGTLDVATSAVEELTGEPAEDVQRFLARHVAALRAPVAA
ncbi:NmrA family transcriptional regulator [Sorangium cellulosum]|uniref:NmrA family transcriptional regulator n=1 Tax=Sorangium cellulosum TaxID=56 RepID=A0A2L0F128_SORCE|nr:SDR family oxidoreductase [Sorangium cellulosum]AUX45236.1 NmrA family transcriptional regulator [Sorangium cellulosum]